MRELGNLADDLDPVGPAPTTTKERKASRSLSSVAMSAISNEPRM
jgi:hypothetical protein